MFYLSCNIDITDGQMLCVCVRACVCVSVFVCVVVSAAKEIEQFNFRTIALNENHRKCKI